MRAHRSAVSRSTTSRWAVAAGGSTKRAGAVVTKLAVLLTAVAGAAAISASDARAGVTPRTDTATAPFVFHTIDPSGAGDVKLVGDMDDDGQLDLVVGGSIDEGLRWYRYPTWKRVDIAVPKQEFTTDGALGDVDGDGDLDVVVGDGDGAENVLWFENPVTGPGTGSSHQWARHVVASVDGFVKDVELADFDGDGVVDVATREPTRVTLLFQDDNAWTPMTVRDLDLGEEGMTSGDVDVDGDVDLVVRGMWTENPGGRDVRDPHAWHPHPIGTAPAAFKALVADVDGDGAPEIMYTSSESVADVVIWRAPDAGPASGPWRPEILIRDLERAHTLQSGDMDGDGDVDLVVAQMHTSRDKKVLVVENLDGAFTRWRVHEVGSGGIHNGVVADIGGDGDLDIIGANWTGNPPVEWWENQGDRTGDWRYVEVTNRHQQTFGLTFADVDGDEREDIVSGGFWYRNPGGELGTGPWKQRALPTGMHAIATLDVDADDRADVIAQRDEGHIGLYWLEAPRSPDGRWSEVKIGSVPRASHELGAQGVVVAQLVPGRADAVLVSSGGGIFSFLPPANGAATRLWHRELVSRRPSDEGLAVADVDGDGLRDVIATTGDSKHVEWYRAPGWDVMHIGDFTSAVFPDRVGAGDLDGDGRVDVVVTSENGLDSGADTTWWVQPAAPGAEWTPHKLVMQATTNSMSVVDMDEDGDLDVVLAEHRGAKRLEIWRNDGTGAFEEDVISTGRENHLGAKPVDIDGDGDLDLVGIGYDEPQFVNLWLDDRLPRRQPR